MYMYPRVVIEVKYILRQEADRWRVYRLKKGTRQAVSIAGRTYPTDEELFYRDPVTSDAWMTIDIDDLQPWRHKPIYYPVKKLSILNLSSKAAGNRKKRLLNLDSKKLNTYLTVGIIGLVMVWYLLTHGLSL